LTPIEDREEAWVEREIVSAIYPDRREVIVDSNREIVGNFAL
jgi:hypothetical protein